ncbi:MARVEL domain-containing protein [Aspergillus mulundensis]|uniref:MARVEL domain-containing protein n=1 Tax=Aspergillus mulundensis TaxID=1810919 RepID=A0A3D8REK5_9EURO|nr:hypothetical protein DSM5745_07644 [Aspergillus mulundensis]RDW72472.1 hypothetical protein DSM5745_07644 [Aspergillus mulundensis]
MWFVLFKIFRFGYSETKKYKAKKAAQQPGQPGQAQFQQPPFPNPYFGGTADGSRGPEQYPMDTYPAPPLPEQTPPPAMGKRAKMKALISTALAILQFAFGLAVIGLYSQDINSARDRGDSAPSRWVYAVVTAFMSTVTALAYLVLGWWWKKRSKPSFSQRGGLFLPLFAWESILVILWLVVFGIFGEMYIGVYHVGGKDGGDSKVTRMRRAVWVDLACLLFWVVSGAWRGVRWWKAKGSGSGPSGFSGFSFRKKRSGVEGGEKEMA